MRKGKAGMINLEVQVKEGYHIQAFEVADEFLVPTKLEFTSPDDFTLESAVFPPSKKFQLEGTDTYLDVYDEQFEILVPFDSKKSIRNGSYRLDGKLTYQACDSVRCLFPRSVEFHIDVQVR